MNKSNLAAALALAAAMGPQMGGVDVLARPSGGVFGDWFKGKGGSRRPSKRAMRDPGPLQRRGFAEIPCDAPEGFFWKRDAFGPAYRLYRKPLGERQVEYDEINDRSIIRSGWGYVKPTYAPGDVRSSR